MSQNASLNKFISILIYLTLYKHNANDVSLHCKRTQTVFNGNRLSKCVDELIFQDDFSGESLDLKKWKLERRFPTEPDYEFNLYIDDAFGVYSVDNGAVSINPRPTLEHFSNISRNLHGKADLGVRCTGRQSTPECKKTLHNGALPPFMSAQFSTKAHFTFKYGRVEIRAKLPKANWVFPQLWLQPITDKYGANDYQSGQFRIAFNRMNGNEFELYGGVIINAMQPWRTALMCRKTGSNINYGNEFHIYTLIWIKDEISIAVDNEEYCRISAREVPLRDRFTQVPNYSLLESGTNLAPFDQEFYVTIGYGIGGHNDFEDSYNWHVPKPWRNTDPKAELLFWKNVRYRICRWLAFNEFIIDYIKVFSV